MIFQKLLDQEMQLKNFSFISQLFLCIIEGLFSRLPFYFIDNSSVSEVRKEINKFANLC
jgi:hypothetical protein